MVLGGLFSGGKDEATRRAPLSGPIYCAAVAGAEDALVDWVYSRVAILSGAPFVATAELAQRLKAGTGLDARALLGRADGGAWELAAEIARRGGRALLCFVDGSSPFSAARDDFDPSPALVAATRRGLPIALNAATADLIATSPLFAEGPSARSGVRPPTPEPGDLAARPSRPA